MINPQFFGVISRASNVSTCEGNYTKEMFKKDFPQLFDPQGDCWVPSAVLDTFISIANKSIQPDKWLDSWRYAAGLFVAHKATLFLRSYGSGEAGSSASAQEAAASGQVVGTVKSATLGDASVNYDDSSSTKGLEDWGDLNSTSYGQALATMARMVGMGGSYVI